MIACELVVWCECQYFYEVGFVLVLEGVGCLVVDGDCEAF